MRTFIEVVIHNDSDVEHKNCLGMVKLMRGPGGEVEDRKELVELFELILQHTMGPGHSVTIAKRLKEDA